jgi:hypothetical protein
VERRWASVSIDMLAATLAGRAASFPQLRNCTGKTPIREDDEKRSSIHLREYQSVLFELLCCSALFVDDESKEPRQGHRKWTALECLHRGEQERQQWNQHEPYDWGSPPRVYAYEGSTDSTNGAQHIAGEAEHWADENEDAEEKVAHS